MSVKSYCFLPTELAHKAPTIKPKKKTKEAKAMKNRVCSIMILDQSQAVSDILRLNLTDILRASMNIFIATFLEVFGAIPFPHLTKDDAFFHNIIE
jgi:hypothetical protein